MTRSTHIRQINGLVRGALADNIRSFPAQIRFSLNLLDGQNTWAYSLWRAPEGADLLDSIPFSEEYIQCGGTAQAATIEVRYLDPDGTPHQYAVGRAGDRSGDPTEKIYYDDGRHHVTVYPSEVFTADEAAAILYQYFLTDKVSQPYVLRDLHLYAPDPAGEEIS